MRKLDWFLAITGSMLLALTFSLGINSYVQAELIVVDVGDSTATFQWTAPGDDGAVGFAAEYDIRYSVTPIEDSTDWNDAIQVENEPVPDTAGTIETFQVTGLEPNMIYFFAIKAVDESGNWSGLSNIAAVRTEDRIAPCEIGDFEAIGP